MTQIIRKIQVSILSYNRDCSLTSVLVKKIRRAMDPIDTLASKIVEKNKKVALVGKLKSGSLMARKVDANASLNASMTTVGVDDFVVDRAALELVVEMRDSKSFVLKDRRYMFKSYKETFYHSQGLAWLMNKVAEFEQEKAESKGNAYDRAEDDMLEWKAMGVGNRLRDAGYLIQVSGKHGFKAHRKRNHLFRYHNPNIDRDLAKPSYQNVSKEEIAIQRRNLFTQRHLCGEF